MSNVKCRSQGYNRERVAHEVRNLVSQSADIVNEMKF
jgi:hypothetical protein